jgi:hypothetical protein
MTGAGGNPLRVAFGVRPDWKSRAGGDTVQIDGTAAALRALGVDVVICPAPADASGFDLVHVFHLGRVHESYPHFRRAVACGKPVVVSTIYWPLAGGKAARPGLCYPSFDGSGAGAVGCEAKRSSHAGCDVVASSRRDSANHGTHRFRWNGPLVSGQVAWCAG